MNAPTVCMLSCLHPLMDDRIYWKEAVSLKKHGYNVVHIGVGDEEKDFVSKEGIRLISVKLGKTKKGNKLTKAFAFLFSNKKKYSPLLEKAIEIKADVYNIHDLQINHLNKSLRSSCPNSMLIYSIHESYPDMIRDYYQTNGIKTILKNLYAFYIKHWEIRKCRLADYLVTFDDAGFEKFSSIFGSKKVSLQYNFARIKINEGVTETKKVYDLVYIGSITEPRGIMHVLEAVYLCKQEKTTFKFLLLGIIHEDALREKINKYILENDISDNVDIIDSVPHEDVIKYLRKCSIGIVTLLPIPKYLKNIPIKQFEYMAAGIPVVGSNIPPIERFIKEADAGIVVDPKNTRQISDAIMKLLADKNLYKTLSQNGINAVKDKFNWWKMEEKMLQIYSQLLQ